MGEPDDGDEPDTMRDMARDPKHRRTFEKLLYLACKRGDADLVARESPIGREVLADEFHVGIVDAEVGAVREEGGFEIAQLTHGVPSACGVGPQT